MTTPPKPIEDTQAIPVDIRETAKEVLHKACRTIFKDEAIDIIAQAILSERQSDEWQPIESLSPKDGMIVVGYGEYRERDGFSPAFMRWYDSVKGWSVNGMPFYPTHWMPLPSPPKTDIPNVNNRFSRKGEKQ